MTSERTFTSDFAKIDMCEIIKSTIHFHNPSISQTMFNHYAVVLPSCKNSGWFEKGRIWNEYKY